MTPSLANFISSLVAGGIVVLAIGIVVDDAIVVVEAVHAKFEGGPSVELMGQRPLDQFTAVSSVCLPRADLLQLDTRFSPIDMQPLLGSKGRDTYQDFVAIHQQIRCDASATAAQAVAALLETSSAGTPQ